MKTTTTAAVIERVWDENERVREGRNGRTYVSSGRWQWLVVVDGVVKSQHDTRRDAVDARAALEGQTVQQRGERRAGAMVRRDMRIAAGVLRVTGARLVRSAK